MQGTGLLRAGDPELAAARTFELVAELVTDSSEHVRWQVIRPCWPAA